MKIHNISDSYKLSAPCSVIFCDLWGVVHNGKEVYENSKNFLKMMEKKLS